MNQKTESLYNGQEEGGNKLYFYQKRFLELSFVTGSAARQMVCFGYQRQILVIFCTYKDVLSQSKAQSALNKKDIEQLNFTKTKNLGHSLP